MKHFKTTAAAAFISVASVGAASASTIHFDVDKGWSQSGHSYGNGSESVQVEAFHYDDRPDAKLMGNPWLASWDGWSGGLGICSGKVNKGACKGDSHTVDGKDGNEAAVLDFGSLIVKLTSITFSYVNKTDIFDVFAFGKGTGERATDWQLDVALPDNCSVCTVSNFSLGQGSIFAIGAFSPESSLKIKAIHFDVIEPEVIPLPAAGWMLLAGLGGIAAIKRRRKAA